MPPVLLPQAIQRRQPRTHTIVEAHPDVHAHMLELGWDRHNPHAWSPIACCTPSLLGPAVHTAQRAISSRRDSASKACTRAGGRV